MNRLIITLCLIACAAGLHAEGSIRWLSLKHDFGAFSEDDEKVYADFKFVNETDQDVAIIQAAATCGCTVPEYNTAPIPPGDTATVRVAFNPTSQAGRFEKYVYVRTTADHERYKLVIKGTVIANNKTVTSRYPVEIGPLKLRNGVGMLGRIERGHGKSAFIDGYNQSADSIRPTFSNVPQHISVSATPEVVPPGDLVSINIYFKGEKCPDWGIINDSIMIAPNPKAETFTLPIVAIVEEDFSALTPEQRAKAPVLALIGDRIDLGDISALGKATAKMEFTNRGENPLLIRRIYSADPAVKAKVSSNSIKKGKKGTITIEYDPAYLPEGESYINTRVSIIANDPTMPVRTLRIVGTIRNE